MRKLSTKWPWTLTVIGFCPPIFYVLFRIRHPENFVFADFSVKVAGGVFVAIIAWVVYWIACLLARPWVSCRYCRFADATQDSQEMKCRLTGYEYRATYPCAKSRPKEKATEVLNDRQGKSYNCSEDLSDTKQTETEYGKVHCKGCGKPLKQSQVDYMLGNQKYNEWCREGFCRLSCFEIHKGESRSQSH
jgi:hypothetical protein